MQAQKTYDQLISDAQELLAKLKDVDTPDVKRLRDRVESAISETKDAVTNQSKAAAKKIDELTQTAIDYAQKNPWVAVAAGVAIVTAVVMVGLSSRSRRD